MATSIMRTRENLVHDAVLNGQQYGLVFRPSGQKCFSSLRPPRLVGVFDSPPVIPSDFLKWFSLEWTSTAPQGTDLLFWVRSAESEDLLEASTWSGPYCNASGNAISAGKQFMQLRAVMSSTTWGEPFQTPSVSQVAAKYFASNGDGVVQTATFELDFIPKYVFAVVSGTVSDGAELTAAVSVKDSADLSNFTAINLNTITELGSNELLSTNMKLMLRLISSSNANSRINGFGLLVSGEDDFSKSLHMTPNGGPQQGIGLWSIGENYVVG